MRILALFLSVTSLAAFASDLSAQKPNALSSAEKKTQAEAAVRRLESGKPGVWNLREQIEIFKSLAVADRVDKRNASVRWTGKLRVPADGSYVFEQVRSGFGGSRAILFLDGKQVLNSRPTEGDTATYRSQPIPLTSGKAIDFRLDFVHDSPNLGDFPVAVLTWESEVLDKQIIPASAFQFADGKNSGLRAEYFADAQWVRRIADRTDEAVDFIWDKEPMENGFSAARRKVAKSGFAKMTNDSFLTAIDPVESEIFAREYVPQLLAGLSASERMVLVDALTRHPKLLRGLPLPSLVLSLQSLGLLDDAKLLPLLAAWAGVNPQPRSVPGSYIRGVGSYVTANVEPYNRIGRVFRQIDSVDFDEILENSCVLPSGECNLSMTYILINAGKSNGRIADVMKAIDAKLSDGQIAGDSKMTWYLAKAYAKEVGLSQMVRPGRGLTELREAFASAESDEYRFWAMQELVARLITLGSKAEVQSLVDSLNNQFPEPEKQELMARWLATNAELADVYHEQQQQSRKKAFIGFSSELNRRGNRMTQAGHSDAARELKRKAADFAESTGH